MPKKQALEKVNAIQEKIQPEIIISGLEKHNFLSLNDSILIIYIIITTILLLKFIFSILKIKRSPGYRIIYKNTNIRILNANVAPFSFLNTIYLSENNFQNSRINEFIFLHEKIHIQQKHSYDLLFLELLIAISWFNPFLFFYKKAIVNNHEFLVDQKVILETKKIKTYQKLIFNEVSKGSKINLANSFNFNNTKKRFIMMTNKNSKFANTKKYFSIPVFIGLALLFTEKVSANETDSIMLKNKQKVLQINEEQEITNPDFPGGINGFRALFLKKFDSSVFSKQEIGTIKTAVNFTIEKDGSVSNIIAIGDNEQFNAEAVRTAKQITKNTKWTPATKNGEPVAYVFKLPLTMTFEKSK